jgi:hypothetical protein
MVKMAHPPTSCADPSPHSKVAHSAEKLIINTSPSATTDNEQATIDGQGLEAVVTGGCSTCGSSNHGTAQCDKKYYTPDSLMMSGALQPGMERSTPGSGGGPSSTAAPAAAPASTSAPELPKANIGKPRRRQVSGRRYST